MRRESFKNPVFKYERVIVYALIANFLVVVFNRIFKMGCAFITLSILIL